MGLVEEGASKGATLSSPIMTDVEKAGSAVKRKIQDISSIPDYAGEKAAQIVNDPNDEGWLTKTDAARHLLGVGELARQTNPTIAGLVGNAREWLEISSTSDREMDLHNNEIALKLFNAKSREELEDRVKTLMKDAQFQSTAEKDKPTYLKR